MIRAVAVSLAFSAALGLAAVWAAGNGERVVAGLSQNRIAITANFVGSEILIFGAVKREAPIPSDRLDVVITVQGPSVPVKVQRKARVFGIWVNRDQVTVDLAPSFYAVATTAPLDQVLSATEDLRNRISIPHAIRSVGAPSGIADSQTFTEALIRLRQASGLYVMAEGSVDLSEETLFRTRVALPANLIEGQYAARIFLTRDRKVVDRLETSIVVRKEGLERVLYQLAHREPLIYGLLSLIIAIVAGWAASSVFRYFRL